MMGWRATTCAPSPWTRTTDGGGASLFDGFGWTNYTTLDGLASKSVTAIAQDAAGDLWFGTLESGASQFDGSLWTTHTTTDGLSSDEVTAIAAEVGGPVWLGTTAGASLWDGLTWSVYTQADDGLVDDGITSVALDGAGHPWLGSWQGLSTYDGLDWITVTTADGLVDDRVNAITRDGLDRLWFGTQGGASVLDGGSWNTYTVTHGLVDDEVQAIGIDGDDQVWFGTHAGASQFDGATWTSHTTADGLAHDSVQAVAADGDNRIWLGTQSGLSEYAPGGVDETITVAEGGALVSADGSTTLTFAPGAVASDLDLLFLPVSGMPTDPYQSIGRFYELFAVHAGTSGPPVGEITGTYSLVVTYTDDQVLGIDEETLGLYSWDGAEWIHEPTSQVSAGSNTVSATPGHFSYWAVLSSEEVQDQFPVYLPLILRESE
jgi:ligand-binding sensor domain-containing protein